MGGGAIAGLPANRPLREEGRNQWDAPNPLGLAWVRTSRPCASPAPPLEIGEQFALEGVAAVPRAGRKTPHHPETTKERGSFGRTRPRQSWRPRWIGARPNVTPPEEHRELPTHGARRGVAHVAPSGLRPGSPQWKAAFGARKAGDLFRGEAYRGHQWVCPRTTRWHHAHRRRAVGLMPHDRDERTGVSGEPLMPTTSRGSRNLGWRGWRVTPDTPAGGRGDPPPVTRVGGRCAGGGIRTLGARTPTGSPTSYPAFGPAPSTARPHPRREETRRAPIRRRRWTNPDWSGRGLPHKGREAADPRCLRGRARPSRRCDPGRAGDARDTP